MPPKQSAPILEPPSENVRFEIGLDECGRGPLFGRVYAAAVILPKLGSESTLFDFSKIKDSKKIHSKKKMRELADHIKEHAIAYSIQFVDSEQIDRINILQADMQAMHECIKEIVDKLPPKSDQDAILLVDGNYFKPYCFFNQEMNGGEGGLFYMTHQTVEQGDSKHATIAAASILAKDARDDYILKLCEEYPELKTRYSLDKNMGYGTKAHLEGIAQYGITQWHRRTFGPCKSAIVQVMKNQP